MTRVEKYEKREKGREKRLHAPIARANNNTSHKGPKVFNIPNIYNIQQQYYIKITTLNYY
jgi:hypothetical protein